MNLIQNSLNLYLNISHNFLSLGREMLQTITYFGLRKPFPYISSFHPSMFTANNLEQQWMTSDAVHRYIHIHW